MLSVDHKFHVVREVHVLKHLQADFNNNDYKVIVAANCQNSSWVT